MAEQVVKRRIGKFTSFLMIFFALILDIIEFILALLLVGAIINRIITIFEYLIYWFWFKVKKASFAGKKMRVAGSFVGEIIPFLGALPLFSFTVWLAIKDVDKEDQQISAQKAKQEQVIVSQNIIRQKRG